MLVSMTLASQNRSISLFVGPCLAAMIFFMPTPTGLTTQGQASLGVLFLCVCWWICGPIALSTTAFIGMILLPLSGAMSSDETISLLGNQAVFFVIAVFLVAGSSNYVGLSKRMGIWILERYSYNANALCNSILGASFFLCFFLVSHAVCALMLPLVLSILRILEEQQGTKLAKRMLLSMAWGTVCGSNLSLLSSARAGLALELLHTYEQSISIGFLEYSLAAVPCAIFSLVLVWALLAWRYPCSDVEIQGVAVALRAQKNRLGRITTKECHTLIITGCMLISISIIGTAWMGVISLFFCVLFFIFRTITWRYATKEINWGIVLLYGGAIAIGSAVYQTGAALWIIQGVLDIFVQETMLLALVCIVVLCTELISNSAVIAIVLPLALILCDPFQLDQRIMTLMVPICAGFAFVLPTSTPAMAMIFGSGHVNVGDTLWGVPLVMGSMVGFFGVLHFWWPYVGMV